MIESDIGPDNTTAIDAGNFDVVFPALHGPFGEGGPLQHLLEARGLCYVGCQPDAAEQAMDKATTKRIAQSAGIPTAPFEVLTPDAPLSIAPPLVLKPPAEGSSFGVAICRSLDEVSAARAHLHTQYPLLMAERFIAGAELTIGVVGGEALPAIRIVPATESYDTAAKYDRNDTQYLFETGLNPAFLEEARDHACRLFTALGCRHLARVDFMVDDRKPWMLEINTMPGFTDHSLLPMAAARSGLPMPELCDRLIRLALQSMSSR